MAMLSSASFHRLTSSSPSISTPIPLLHPTASALPKCTTRSSTNRVYFTPFSLQNPIQSEILHRQQDEEEIEMADSGETVLYSISPLPLLVLAALPGGGAIRSVFGPFVELVKSWNLPDWLVHWGHPGNMAVVLFAMGGYGTYLGFRIRFSDDVEEKAMAKDLHPKLLAGMFFFFALGATGGVTSLLTSDKPILESPHAVTGLIGLTLLAIQTALPTLFEGNPGLRNVHGILGSGIMTLFVVHAALGLQLGLSY
ncbi:hypothetical protein L1987_81531 [Smallanthus sonchifolius]|uniref:Uncharacterized protein n=1 Tax=Smallanthus sonchifolius TaxID=185202 RepID=A0ACB8YRT4_9ASTR|nr:hypothetical protein L1987_81531 [Smallanthus sonchifolius]